jgi:hypothetical protein
MSKPSDAREIAIALPIPLLAPVMTATGLLFILANFQVQQKYGDKGNNLIKSVNTLQNYLPDNLSTLFQTRDSAQVFSWVLQAY